MNLLSKSILALLSCHLGTAAAQAYHNPVLPGWHSDPSCVTVDDTFYCVTSTFISFPGLPIYASKDLINWKLVSHVWNRESQLPGISWNTWGQKDGMYAPTIRYRDGQFYVACEYLGQSSGIMGLLFKSTDPFSDESWNDPVHYSPNPERIDPDLFWDDDGKVYSATHGIILQELDLETGAFGPATTIWEGTGGVWPEGPHIIKKDGYHYVLIAEGGTGTDHAVTIARSKNGIHGPYESNPNNPILSNRGTNEYFQTVGHADLFQDPQGNWWGMCLATRSGPSYQTYPMGREAVLFPVTWDEGEWPVMEPIRGEMTGWPLPETNREVPGDGPFNSDPDVYDFEEETIPRNLVYWRVPREGTFTTTGSGLQVIPSRNNLTGTESTAELSGRSGLAFIGRRQTHTTFTFTVDLTFDPKQEDQEAGVTVFLTQFNHIDLGVIRGANNQISLRFRAEGTGTRPAPIVTPIPAGWDTGPIRLQIQANDTHYELSGMSAADPEAKIVVASAPASLVSGGAGSFVGSLVGAFATCNGKGTGVDCPEGGHALFQRWRYTGESQYITETRSIPAA